MDFFFFLTAHISTVCLAEQSSQSGAVNVWNSLEARCVVFLHPSRKKIITLLPRQCVCQLRRCLDSESQWLLWLNSLSLCPIIIQPWTVLWRNHFAHSHICVWDPAVRRNFGKGFMVYGCSSWCHQGLLWLPLLPLCHQTPLHLLHCSSFTLLSLPAPLAGPPIQEMIFFSTGDSWAPWSGSHLRHRIK